MNRKTPIRSESLDTLRGLAILMMVLSGAVPFSGALPGWMYHAQEPPPEHIFRFDVPGITWVDLVFPFFIFSMGTAIPFALSSRITRGMSSSRILGHTTIRWIALSLFAFMVYNIRPWVITAEGIVKWLFCLLGFVFLAASFIKLPTGTLSIRGEKAINAGGLILITALILWLNNSSFITLSLGNFDIIIMVLACISLFGGIIQLASNGSTTVLAVCWSLMTLFYIAVKLFSSPGAVSVWDYSPAPWLISWEYLKYLIILIPGIWTGNVLKEFQCNTDMMIKGDRKALSLSAVLLLSVNIIIVSCLYLRLTFTAVICSAVMLTVTILVLRKWQSAYKSVLIRLLTMSSILILAGLAAEPLQGGIKKDPATLSYLVLTPGMAISMLVFFIITIDIIHMTRFFSLLSGSGKNAMLAYFTGSNLIMPLLGITGVSTLVAGLPNQALWQTVLAIAITLLTAWVSTVASGKKIFLKA